MKKTENGKIFAFIAASLLMGYWLHQVSGPSIRFLYYMYMEYGVYNLSLIIDFTALLGIAVTLFTRSKKAILAACGSQALVCAYSLIRHFSVGNLVYFLLFAGMVALLVLSLKKSAMLKKIWFIPAAIYALYNVINEVMYICKDIRFYLKYDSLEEYLEDELLSDLRYLLLSIIYIAIWFLVCLWIKKSTEPVKIVSENENATLNTQTADVVPTPPVAIGGADQLKTYKELLDMGAITQEEFDAKKKEILNL